MDIISSIKKCTLHRENTNTPKKTDTLHKQVSLIFVKISILKIKVT